MQTLVLIFSIIIWAFGAKTAEAVLPANHITKDVSVVSNQLEIKGTMVTPAESKNYPIVLFIAGSGPTDRDGNQPTLNLKNNSFKILAEEFAEKGIASVRYDKRGIAGSYYSGFSNASVRFDDYVTDAENWIRKLKTETKGSKLFVVGLSEGSLIGMIASRNAGADGFISLNGPGSPADELILQQISRQGTPVQVVDQVKVIIGKIKTGEKVDTIPPYLMSLFNPDIQPYLKNWFSYNPTVEITKMKVPVLIVQGKNDLQVKVTDAELLKKALPTAQLLLVDNMNHILKNAPEDMQGNFATYNKPELPVNETLISNLVDFILR